MMSAENRVSNFYAGPSTLPVDVIAEISENFADYNSKGLSIIEASHRSDIYREVHVAAVDLSRELLGISDSYDVLFLGGGATLQFAMIPMNLIPHGGVCDFIVSGIWAAKAKADAELVGGVRTLFDGAESNYTSLPDEIGGSSDSSYLHITSNETINGIQWREFPSDVGAPIVADMSSDIMSRPIDVGGFGLIYAGAQKNLGPAGVTLVIIRKDLVARGRIDLPSYLSYRTHAAANSLHNTPPVFSIYALRLVLEWVKRNGGVKAMHEASDRKSSHIYGAIDGSAGFYRSPVMRSYRSRMNIVFRLPSESLERSFLAESESIGMLGLRGHRSVGGVRASLYNALPEEWARSLSGFMEEFARRNG